jgi:uncharacterized radical SAM protein YgiQ
MLLPTTQEELRKLTWDRLDVILVTGDCYVDSPFIGVSVIGNILVDAGLRVGIIAQPDWRNKNDIRRLGEPELFWGITGGCMDSMVANYTAVKKRRLSDDLTPGGKNNRRPDRAVIVYANLIRQCFKNTKPLVLGGVEASLRRIAHYDYWTDTVRRSILFDARADILAYGMAEKATLELARILREGKKISDIRGICYIASSPPSGFLELPSYEDVCADKKSFMKMFEMFYHNNDPMTARGLFQRHQDRFLVHNPPQHPLTPEELDNLYALNFTRDVHPFYRTQGKVRAMETIRFSITSHRGCYGECNFCSIGLHEGRTVVSRSEKSIIAEAQKIAALHDFKGYLSDVGGATANMYGIECARKLEAGACRNKRCLFPKVCENLKPDHGRQIRLLRVLGQINGVKKVFVASGIRYDLLLADKKNCLNYMRQLIKDHVSGQLKVAPEHVSPETLKLMGKPKIDILLKFKQIFENISKQSGRKQFLTYYFMAAHPGCTEENMRELKAFVGKTLKTHPRQVQIFTPLPSTYSALWYFTQTNAQTGKSIFVEKDTTKKQRQKNILFGKK